MTLYLSIEAAAAAAVAATTAATASPEAEAKAILALIRHLLKRYKHKWSACRVQFPPSCVSFYTLGICHIGSIHSSGNLWM